MGISLFVLEGSVTRMCSSAAVSVFLPRRPRADMRRAVASGLALGRARALAVMLAQSSDTPRVCYDVLV